MSDQTVKQDQVVELTAADIRRQMVRAIEASCPEAKMAILDLVEKVVDHSDVATEIDVGLLESLLNGHVIVVAVDERGEMSFSLTQAGVDYAQQMLYEDPESRAIFGALNGRPISDPPTRPQ